MPRRTQERSQQTPIVIITCEHGGHRVPREFRHLFRGHAGVLRSHRGWDPGTLSLAKQFAVDHDAPLHFSTITRLLVELNRSRHHSSLFSEFTRHTETATRTRLVNDYWRPYRDRVEGAIAKATSTGRCVLHLSVHTFSPTWKEEIRRTEVGLLYDPGRDCEREFCRAWKDTLAILDGGLVVHRNAPYRGIADGFVTYLRRRKFADLYLGLELEVNQKYCLGSRGRWNRIRSLLVESFNTTVQQFRA